MIVMQTKKELRKEIRARKNQFTQAELHELSSPIIDKLLAHPKLQEVSTIMLYNSLPDEVNTHKLIDLMASSGKKVLLPVVVSDTDMEVRCYTGPADLRESSFHIMEPIGEPFTELSKIELIVVPGMSFDEHCNRLGRGRGYYDRFLPKIPQAYKIGICFDFQKLPDIPFDPTDFKVDEVL
jgi:hypothetical protein